MFVPSVGKTPRTSLLHLQARVRSLHDVVAGMSMRKCGSQEYRLVQPATSSSNVVASPHSHVHRAWYQERHPNTSPSADPDCQTWVLWLQYSYSYGRITAKWLHFWRLIGISGILQIFHHPALTSSRSIDRTVTDWYSALSFQFFSVSATCLNWKNLRD